MTEVEHFRASFASRLVVVFASTLLFIFTALLILDNKELHKFAPPSTLRSAAILCGYTAGILSLNYIMAVRGRNFSHWLVELLISFNFILLLATATLPWLFPTTIESAGNWKTLWVSTKTTEPNYNYFWLLILEIPLFLYTAYRIRSHFRIASEA